MADLADLDLEAAGRALRTGAVTSLELTRAVLDRIARRTPELHAFTTVTEARALSEAARADRDLRAGRDRGPMHGLPYAVKDLIDVEGLATTCNSHASDRTPAAADAAVVARLTAGGAVLVGKLNLSEYGAGGSGRGLPFPKARNPWDHSREPGFSSTGLGVALAAKMLCAGLGTDTGGSLRQPAAYCGVVGLKPTAGRVSRTGVDLMSPTLDHCGPMGRTVADATRLLQAAAGHDPTDPASRDVAVPDWLSELQLGVGGLRIGLPKAMWGFDATLDPALSAALDRAAGALVSAGAQLVEVTLPPLEAFRAAGMAIMLGEGFATHRERLRDRLADYSPETAERFLVGVLVTPEVLARARRVRRRLIGDITQVFETVDLLLMPTVVGAAPRLEAAGDVRANPNRMPALPFNLSGHPALSLPIALDRDGLPLALQLTGRPWAEGVILRCAAFLERESGWNALDLAARSAGGHAV